MGEIKTFNISALAEFLNKTPNAIVQLRYKIRRGEVSASALPAPLDLPSRSPLWDSRDVERWLDAHRAPRRGPPTKVERIAKRKADAAAGGVQS